MIIFSRHAAIKLRQRGIKKALVHKTVRYPDYQFFSQAGRVIAYKRFGKLFLKVVFLAENSNKVIITQFWDSLFKPKAKL